MALLDNPLEYAQKRIEKELDNLYNETIGEVFPSIFLDLPSSIIRAVTDDPRFWNETLFIGLSNYIKSKREPISEMLNLLENDFFRLNNRGSNIVRQLLAGSISEAESNDFLEEPIRWLRDWLESDDVITVNSDASVREDINFVVNRIILAIIILVGLFLVFFIIIKKPKLNIGGTTKILLENIFNNVRNSDKTITGGLTRSILNVVDSWVNKEEKSNILKNAYILLNEINKIAKSVGYSTEVLTDRDARNARINTELTTFVRSIGDNASKIFQNIFKKGGLWKGDSMDYILADMIYARVKIEFDGNENSSFLKRNGKDIIDWTDKESREQHPLSKTVKKINNITGKEIGADLLHKSFMGMYAYLDDGANELNTSNFFLNELSEAYKDFKKYSLGKLSKNKIIKELNTSNDTISQYKKELNTIINKFTFKDFYKIFGVDFVVSGSNITSAQPVYFNHSLTPNISVIKAVRISSNFPILFQPIKLTHTEKEVVPKVNYAKNPNNEIWVKNKEDYYSRNYSGFFIDGGLLNNFPMNAFNQTTMTGYEYADPKSKMDLFPNNKVFGLKLGSLELKESKELEKMASKIKKYTAEGEDKRLDQYSHDEGTGIKEKIKIKLPKFEREKYEFDYPEEINFKEFLYKNYSVKKEDKFKLKNKKLEEIKKRLEQEKKKRRRKLKEFDKNKDKTMGILSIVSKLFGTTLDDSMDGRNSAFFDRNEQIVRLYTGRISLFDLVTKESELALVDLFSYSEIYKHFNQLDSLPPDWEKDIFKRLKRNSYLKNKWRRETKDRSRLRLRRRHF